MARITRMFFLFTLLALVSACAADDTSDAVQRDDSADRELVYESDYADADAAAFIVDATPWQFRLVEGTVPEDAEVFAMVDSLPTVAPRDARRIRRTCSLVDGRYTCDALGAPHLDGWQKSSLMLWQKARGKHALLWAVDGLESISARTAEVAPPPPILGALVQVVDEDGRAVRGAKVQPILGHGAPLPWVDAVVTDGRGRARLTGLSDAPWQLQITSAIHAPVRVTPELTLGEANDPERVVLPRGAQVDAAVADTAGRRVDDAVAFVEFENDGRDDTTHVAFRVRKGRLIAALPRSRPFVLRVKADGHRWWQRRQLDVESIDIHLETP